MTVQVRADSALRAGARKSIIQRMMKNASTTMETAAVEIRGLTVIRGRRTVIEGLDLDLGGETGSGGQGGGVVGLLGPSGCGKTTLLRAVVGVQRIAAGTVRVFGRDAGSAPLRSRIGYHTQAGSVYDDLSVSENLRFFARVRGLDRAEADRVLADVDLADRGESVVGELSGGQRARVSLAVALLGDPDLLVLDEPTVGLDPVLRAELWALFHRLAAAGRLVLVSSHVMDEADRCDRLLLMREGEIIADAPPSRIRERTGEPDIEHAFLAIVKGAQR